MRDGSAHGLMFALGAAAAIGALWLLRRRSACSTCSEAGASSAFSWLEASGSAENVFGKPYAASSGKRDEDVRL